MDTAIVARVHCEVDFCTYIWCEVYLLDLLDGTAEPEDVPMSPYCGLQHQLDACVSACMCTDKGCDLIDM